MKDIVESLIKTGRHYHLFTKIDNSYVVPVKLRTKLDFVFLIDGNKINTKIN
uniref:Uncharacterized protein n=1 Tax=viral metagenome TaxID=1070528 RepID=A0A6C0EA96_9ZZZZ